MTRMAPRSPIAELQSPCNCRRRPDGISLRVANTSQFSNLMSMGTVALTSLFDSLYSLAAMESPNVPNAYRPAIPRHVDQAQLISEASAFFNLTRSQVEALYRTYHSFHEEQRYAERLGERKTLCFEEAFLLFIILATVRPKTIVEIGTQYGGSTRRIIDMKNLLGLTSRVICFDIVDRVKHFSPSEAKLILKDATGCFRQDVLQCYHPELILLDAHPYALIHEVINETLGDDGQPILAIHDCSRGLCNPQMTLTRDDPAITSRTGVWERHILAEIFGMDDPLDPALDQLESPSHRLAVFGTPHGLAVLAPKRPFQLQHLKSALELALNIQPREKTVVAFGPAIRGRGSWEWVGADLQRELSKYFTTVTFGADWDVPDCDVLIAVKHRPPLELVHRIQHRSRIVYCPLDYYPSASRIESHAETLRKCDLIVVHCHRLRKHFERYTAVEYMDHHTKYAAPFADDYKPEGFILWVGVRNNLRPLVRWVNEHPLPCELCVSTNLPHVNTNPAELGFRADRNIRLEPWSAPRQLELMAEAKAAIDIKGGDFQHQHKPPTKALDFIASGMPLAMNPDSSPVEFLARLGFQVALPTDPDHWSFPGILG